MRLLLLLSASAIVSAQVQDFEAGTPGWMAFGPGGAVRAAHSDEAKNGRGALAFTYEIGSKDPALAVFPVSGGIPRMENHAATTPLSASVIDAPKAVERAPAKAQAKKRRTAKAAKPVQEPELARIVPEPPAVEPDPEPEHAPIAPLFEPEPFVRQQQRAAFGRKAG